MADKKRKFQSTKKFCNEEDEENKIYRFNVLLPNGINVPLLWRNPESDGMSMEVVVEKVKEKCNLLLKQIENLPKRNILWDSKDLCLEDVNGKKFKSGICFADFKQNKSHILKLFDGTGQVANYFENMWDLTPDSDLLTELPEDYTFVTALADLIDNSLQAVWSNGKHERKLISVEITEDEVSVFDSGPGMDASDENSIVKWGKMGASVHRSSKKLAIGGKPPYLTPFFGMFGYGGTVASMHLGRYAIVFAKTKESKKVYWLRLDRNALLKRSGSDLSWKAAGGMRNPSEIEIEMSPHGSFTKILMKPKLKLPDIFQLQCKLKDIYFPYIQCDEISKAGRTTTLVDFQINGINLAEVEGGEVAVTNLHSCNGPDFVLNLQFHIEEDRAASKSSSSVKSLREGNARLKCVYFPITQGKESIQRILEKLNADGYDIKEDYDTSSRISIRRLGRLLPEARWELLPFMKPKQKRGAKVQLLKRCCLRVKCFIDTDAGFDPIPSKTDLAPQHSFTKALKDLGGDSHDKEKAVQVKISRDGKQLTPQQLEKEYQGWILQMHSQYDDECNCGDDEAVMLVGLSNKEALGITSDVVRVHQAISRKGRSWNRGQRVKILKGACTGCHKSNMFATLEYFLLEGFERDAGGEARIICRPLGVDDEDGSVLTVDANCANLELRSSISLPIVVIDSGKCNPVNDNEWNCRSDKLNLKTPSTIDVLGPEHCKMLDIDGALPTDASVSAGSSPPKEVVAVLRQSNFSPSSTASDLDQKYILRDESEMCMDIKFKAEAGKCPKFDQIFTVSVRNTSQKGCQGLYIFPVGSIPSLFQKAGMYSFTFSLKNSATVSCEKIVSVKASTKVKHWKLIKDKDQSLPLSVRAGSCFPALRISGYDEFDNIIAIKSTPMIECRLISDDTIISHVKNLKVELSSDMHYLIIANARVKSDQLDNIRPNYEATLALSQPDRQPFIRIPCRVFPGTIRSVNFLPSDLGKSVLPQQVFEDFKLEMLDRDKNHVEEGTEVELDVHGFSFLDKIGLKRKVDDEGFIDLSGLLKVTGSYGKPVSLSVKYNEHVIVTKKFQVEKRELRKVTQLPEFFPAGSKLKDVAFEVVNAEGQVDPTFDDEAKHGKSHTLRIKTELPNDDSVRYAFRRGRCIVQSIALPQREGSFWIEAVHFHHQELRVKFEVKLSRSSQTQNDITSDLQGMEELDCDVPQYSDERVNPHYSPSGSAEHVRTNQEFECQNSEAILAQTPSKQTDPNYEHSNEIFKSPEAAIISAHTYTPEHAIALFRPDLQDFESAEKEVHYYEMSIKEQEYDMKWSEARKSEIEDELRHLEAQLEELSRPKSQLDSMSQKEVVLENIENKVDSAAATYSIASKNTFSKDGYSEFMTDVVGLVALLATAPTAMLSRSLAEYLGEDQMLGIVCRSNTAITTPEKYEAVLKSLAGKLGKRFGGRQLIICLEDIRAYAGDVLGNDHQRKLMLPNPTLPDGTTPLGFLGYAVNMIDIDVDHFQVETVAGYGLRETLFYHLFGDLQVYETKEQMIHARSCVTNAALSLDGGIMRQKGTISIGGCMQMDVHFPVVAQEEQIKKDIAEKKSELSIVEELIDYTNKKRHSLLKTFGEREAYMKKMIEDEGTRKLILSQESLQTTPMAPAPVHANTSPGY